MGLVLACLQEPLAEEGWIGWPSLPSMLTERFLISELKRDWRREARKKNYDTKVASVPILLWTKSESSQKKGEPQRDKSERSGRERSSRRRRDEEPGRREKDDEPRAEFNGKLLTFMKRRFNFLHMYAGKKDPLGEAIRREAKNHRMKVTVISCEKENWVDLLQEQSCLDYLDKAKGGTWDGMHSGFPCISFSKLRWRQAEGYPGPVRDKRHPYGIPGLPSHRQREADEKTLHASRTAHMADAIIASRPEDKMRPFATIENPPPSEHPQHLSAWELPEIANLFTKYEHKDFIFTTCSFQQELEPGTRTFKPQMFGGTLPGLSSLRGGCSCGDAQHVPVIGKERSAASGEYPEALCTLGWRSGNSRRWQAQAEFITKRQEDLAKEVAEQPSRSIRQSVGRDLREGVEGRSLLRVGLRRIPE